MAEVKIDKIDKIEVFIRERLDNDPFKIAIAKAYGVKPDGATVGVKISIGGKWYGTWATFKKSTLSASEVAESINEQFVSVLEEVGKNG